MNLDKEVESIQRRKDKIRAVIQYLEDDNFSDLAVSMSIKLPNNQEKNILITIADDRFRLIGLLEQAKSTILSS